MVRFSEVTIDDKPVFDKYLQAYPPEISELTFTNLFMWRNYYYISYAEVNGALCIFSKPDFSEPFAFMPLGALENEVFWETVDVMKEALGQKHAGLTFKRVAEKDLHYFEGNKRVREMIPDRESSDYVYLSQDLIHLKGKKYHSKRNHINKFMSEYSFEYVPLKPEYMEECYRIMVEWCLHKGCDQQKALYCEKIANMEALKNYSKLDLRGALMKVDGRFEAFTIGEMLNNDTAVIHIEKANDRIRGIYTVINQKFCENEWSEVPFINREQDLGIEGLRKAKLSYHPVKMINKYTVVVD